MKSIPRLMRGTKAIEAAAPGKRAANKADKLRRITSAARELFVENGYDGTTMRDIAARAKVGFGTIFDYASNKRDLLFLIFNPELEQALDQSLAAAATEKNFIDKLMALFSGYYALYAREKEISRLVLRELTFFSTGSEAKKFIVHRARFLKSVNKTVREAMAAGVLRAGEPELVGRIIFALFAWEVRRWLADEAPSVARGLTDLRQLLAVQIAGFEPNSDQPVRAKRQRGS
jgi:AcrR family transcriptional regulator